MGGGGRGRAEKKKRERGVLKSPCEESAISQAKCEWLTQLSEGGESIPRGERGMFLLDESRGLRGDWGLRLRSRAGLALRPRLTFFSLHLETQAKES